MLVGKVPSGYAVGSCNRYFPLLTSSLKRMLSKGQAVISLWYQDARPSAQLLLEQQMRKRGLGPVKRVSELQS